MKIRVDCFLPGMGTEQAKSVTDGLRREEAVDKIFWVDGSENGPADECENRIGGPLCASVSSVPVSTTLPAAGAVTSAPLSAA